MQAREEELQAELSSVRADLQARLTRESESEAKAQSLQEQLQQLQEQSGESEATRVELERVVAEKAELQASETLDPAKQSMQWRKDLAL